MKKKLHSLLGTGVFLSLLLLNQKTTTAQSVSFGNPGLEIGLNVGPMNFLGDVGGNYGRGTGFLKDNNFQFFRLMKGAYVSAQVHPALAFRVAINSGRLEGHDSVIVSKGGLEEARKARDLGFRSNLFEMYVGAEIYPTVLFEADPSDVWHKFRPYGLVGIGMFRFNPQGQYIDPATGQKSWVDLKPLRTEGQGMAEYPDRKEYKLTQMHVPVGIGFKYFVNERFHIGLEVTHRVTFTDYIDDVSTDYINPALFSNYLLAKDVPIAFQMSDRQNFFQTNSRPGFTRREGDQRGNPNNNDSFFSFGLKFGWRIGSLLDPSVMRQSKCPVW
jgi:hypothetical protein